ncbi:DUF2721 domain-containing protein [Planctobacterium marinum]|uniref:DUF2721 domain-containing protein n=1 Tax=Planctobacterium marinum TaxID=1631968 RepID=UPI001E60D619|nr:DUF2721 domain-containing protein [Planctobacterium marinum]MCC2608144.1 DUF2721 domain-containing protein [Planctobacterium marinum]
MSGDVLEIIHIGQVIQAAVAPVFLITGIAALLGVASNRLMRIMDRSRELENSIPDVQDIQSKKVQTEELRYLWKRISLINKAYSLYTLTALLLCVVITVLFISHIYTIQLSVLISAIFIGALMVLIMALMFSLREIFLTTRSLQIRLKLRNLKIPKH